MAVRPRPRAVLLSFLLLLMGAGAAAGQAAPASPFLEADHWVNEVLRRLAAAGHVDPIHVVGRRTLTRAEAEHALERAGEIPGATGAVAAAARERLVEEFPLTAVAREGGVGLHPRLAAGYARHDDPLATGTGYGRDDIPSWPPEPRPDMAGWAAGLEATARLGRPLALTVAAARDGADWRLRTAQGVLAVGPVLLWGGRRPVGYGPGAGGGIVLGDRAVVDGGGIQLAAPVTGRGLLRVFGPFHFEMHLGRMGPTGQVEDPWFWAARAAIQPHPRLLLGINRGALFGGEGNVDTTLRDLFYIAIGKHAATGSILENQVVSVDAVYRLPLPVDVEAYLEWGLDDSAGAWRNVPGVTWGVSAHDLPGLPQVRLGVEHTGFARACCGNPIWYRHHFLHGGWTEDRVPLGHPLGGHGDEWLVHASRGFLEQRLQLQGSVALRERRSENLYAPDRVGDSRAATLLASYRHGSWGGRLEWRVEDGVGWRENQVEALVSWSP